MNTQYAQNDTKRALSAPAHQTREIPRHKMPLRAWLAGCALMPLLFALACSSSTPGGAALYDEGQPPKLLNTEILVETKRDLRGRIKPDLRRVICKDGNCWVEFDSPSRQLKGRGAVPFEVYAQLWNELLDKNAMERKSEPWEPKGGYYHLITMRKGIRTNQFSAQSKTNFLGLNTRAIAERMDLLNEIVRVVEKHVDKKKVPKDEKTTKEKP